MDFVLQDSRSFVGPNMQFWQHSGGYCTALALTERFSLEDAVRQFESRGTDIPWPIDYLRERAIPVVDTQYVKPCQSLLDLGPPTKFLWWVGDWAGNDLIWRASTGKASQNFSLARRYSAEEVLIELQGGVDIKGFYRECDLIPAVRQVVLASEVNHQAALAAANVTLPRPVARPKKRRAVENCAGCGRFVSPVQAYTGCPWCNTGH